MRKALYMRLALQNIRKNGRFYIPYILTVAGTSGAFYIMLALNGNAELPERIRYSYLSMFVAIGTAVIALFSVIFLFYTNSFLMKRRTRELGLYHILGMEKRHIARILGWETVFTALFGIGSGIAFGIGFQKLVTLLLYKIMRFDVYYGFYIFGDGIKITALVFAAILFVCLLFNLGRIHAQKPIELLRSANTGEKEPKTRWLLTILGLLSLGAGYYIAVTTKGAMEALTCYFPAVFLVIIGTYCLFTSVSIALLKLLRKNKKFYYKTSHFIGVSGMLYRMKRNAVGLANICILSTMVLVMVSGTLALFLGTEGSLNARYPADINVEVRYNPNSEDPFRPEDMKRNIFTAVEKQGRKVESHSAYTVLNFAAGIEGKTFVATAHRSMGVGYAALNFITADEYNHMTGSAVTLGKDEVLLYALQGNSIGNFLDIRFDSPQNPSGEHMRFSIRETLDSFPGALADTAYLTAVNSYYAVVSDETVLRSLYDAQAAAYDKNKSSMCWKMLLDIDGTNEEKTDCAVVVSAALPGLETTWDEDGNIHSYESENSPYTEVGNFDRYWTESRAANAEDFYSMNGGFFFLGVFLGLLFIMATVLIIYYKQISEGYEDAGRYRIMQQVGLSRADIRRSVNSQILVVFFMPLAVATVHILFNFPLIKLLLTLFQLTDTALTLWCTAGTLLAFSLIYGVVYALTAKVYYRLVADRKETL